MLLGPMLGILIAGAPDTTAKGNKPPTAMTEAAEYHTLGCELWYGLLCAWLCC